MAKTTSKKSSKTNSGAAVAAPIDAIIAAGEADTTVSVTENAAGDQLVTVTESTAAPVQSADVVFTESVPTGAAADDAGLQAMFESLGLSDADIATQPPSEEALNAAVNTAQAVEASLAQATPDGVVEAGAVPTGTATDVVVEKAEKVKKVAVPRKHYSDKVERLKDRMGENLAGFTVLTIADAEVADADLKAVMDSTLAIIKAMNKKEQARASMMLEFLAGKKPKPNEILERAIKVLNRDGFISTGNDGNLFKDLVARPYSHGAARAMGGNTVSMLADLKLLVADGKQKFVGNPESLLLMKANSMILAAPAATA